MGLIKIDSFSAHLCVHLLSFDLGESHAGEVHCIWTQTTNHVQTPFGFFPTTCSFEFTQTTGHLYFDQIKLKHKTSNDTVKRTFPVNVTLSPVSSIWDCPDLVEATTAAVACVTPRDAVCRRCRLVLSLSAFTWRDRTATRQQT